MRKIKEIIRKYKCEGMTHSGDRLLVLMIILILLMATITRSYGLYARYSIIYPEKNANNNILGKLVTDTNDAFFEMLINDGYEKAIYLNKIATNNLEKDLINNHTNSDLERLLTNNEYPYLVFNTIKNADDEYFKSSNTTYNSFLMLGTENKIIYAKSNVYKDKFSNMLGDSESIPWDLFFDELNSYRVIKPVFENLRNSTTKTTPVILKMTGDTIDDKIYTIEEISEIYKREGVDSLAGFGFVTLTTITEDGDILGHLDSIFMKKNPDCHKIYIYHFMDIREYTINNLDELTNRRLENLKKINDIEKEALMDLLYSASTIILNILAVIGLMFVYKSLDDEDE